MTAVLSAVLAAALMQGAEAQVRSTAHARVAKAQAMAADAVLQGAIAASNSRGVTLAEVQRHDAAWMADSEYPLRRQIVGAPCSRRMRELTADDPLIVEAFVADANGALVCATSETSDYWQGDEDKWLRTFKEGRPMLVEAPALDLSTGTYGIQLSIPVSDGGRRIGSLTLTLKVPRDYVR